VDHDVGYKDDLLQFIYCQASLLEDNRDKIKTLKLDNNKY
jgi:hypothetical protein